MIQLKIIIASTRSGRKGSALADWIMKRAKLQKKFKVQLIDLAEVNLPFLDEPEMAILQKYKHEHTKKWSKTINKSDAFIFVTPEYNNSYPATIKNALDYLFLEWNYKSVGFVSYGGVAGGTRAVQDLKVVLDCLKMVPLKEAVNIPFFEKHLDVDGNFVANKEHDKAAEVMFKEIVRWAGVLEKMRKKQ